jgi:hypothetical protein
MAQQVEMESGATVRDGARELREDVSREKIDRRLSDAVEERPLVQHMLRWPVVLRAVAVAAVVALVFLVLGHPRMGAVLMVLSFFGAWAFFAARGYDKRRPTKPADENEEEDDS